MDLSEYSDFTVVSGLTPRSEFTAKKKNRSKLALSMVMSCLETIHLIRDSFKGSVSLVDFIRIMRNNLDWTQLNVPEEEIVHSLIDLFNGMTLHNGMLKFDDFLATIISTGTDGAEFTVINPVPKYVPGPSPPVSHRVDKVLKYIPAADKLLLLEKNSFRLINPVTFDDKSSKPNLSTCGSIITAEYIPPCSAFSCPFDMIALATTQAISLWENVTSAGIQAAVATGYYNSPDVHTYRTSIFKNRPPGGPLSANKVGIVQRFELPTSFPQTALKWSVEHGFLYSGGMDGIVRFWHMEYGDKNGFMKDQHRDVVSSLEMVPKLDMLASGSLDADIRFWDLTRGSTRKTLSGHKKGIVSLSYSDEYRFLLSGSFDHTMCIWSPFADRLVFRLTGHNSPICSAQFLTNTPQVVSVDLDGWIKVWDIRNFQCVDTYHSISDVCSFTAAEPLHQRLFIASAQSIVSFDQEVAGNDYNVINETEKENQPIVPLVQASTFANSDIISVYNPFHLSFATASGKDIKFWDALNGKQQRYHKNIVDEDITALCIDDKGRKLFVGDRKGNILELNFSNCSPLRKLCGHVGEVCALTYNSKDSILISSGWDGIIYVHDDKLRDDEKHPKATFMAKITGPNKASAAKLKKSAVESVNLTENIKEKTNSRPSTQQKASSSEKSKAAPTGNFPHSTSSSDIYPCVCVTSNILSLVAFTSADPVTISSKASSQIHMFDLETGRPEESCMLKRVDVNGAIVPTAITTMTFLEPYPLIAAGDEDGSISVYFTRPSHFRGQFAFRFLNANAKYAHNEDVPTCAVSALIFDSLKLYTGDLNGLIRCWNLSTCIAEMHESPVTNSSLVLMDKKKQQPNLEEAQRQRSSSVSVLSREAVLFSPSSVPLPLTVFQCRGHGAGCAIRSLAVLINPSCIMSTGGDHVLFWDLESGICLSSLSWNRELNFEPAVFGVTSTIVSEASSDLPINVVESVFKCPWLLRVDLSKRKEEESALANNILGMLDSGSTPMKQEKLDDFKIKFKVNEEKKYNQLQPEKPIAVSYLPPVTYTSSPDAMIDTIIRTHPMLRPSNSTKIIKTDLESGMSPTGKLKKYKRESFSSLSKTNDGVNLFPSKRDSKSDQDDELSKLIDSALKAADSKLNSISKDVDISHDDKVTYVKENFQDELEKFKQKVHEQHELVKSQSKSSLKKSANQSYGAVNKLNTSESVASIKSSASTKSLFMFSSTPAPTRLSKKNIIGSSDSRPQMRHSKSTSSIPTGFDTNLLSRLKPNQVTLVNKMVALLQKIDDES